MEDGADTQMVSISVTDLFGYASDTTMNVRNRSITQSHHTWPIIFQPRQFSYQEYVTVMTCVVPSDMIGPRGISLPSVTYSRYVTNTSVTRRLRVLQRNG